MSAVKKHIEIIASLLERVISHHSNDYVLCKVKHKSGFSGVVVGVCDDGDKKEEVICRIRLYDSGEKNVFLLPKAAKRYPYEIEVLGETLVSLGFVQVEHL